MVDEWIGLISNVGFPIAITLWFMYRMEKVINKNTESIIKNSEVIENLQITVGGCKYNGRNQKG